MWILDFLSDKDVINNEIKIGALQYIHHLLGAFTFGILILLLTSRSIPLTIVSIIVIFITQLGFLINKDYCWLLTLTNKTINPNKPNRKWRADVVSIIKHYTRGDDWAYEDINYNINCHSVKVLNVAMILQLLKIIIT